MQAKAPPRFSTDTKFEGFLQNLQNSTMDEPQQDTAEEVRRRMNVLPPSEPKPKVTDVKIQ